MVNTIINHEKYRSAVRKVVAGIYSGVSRAPEEVFRVPEETFRAPEESFRAQKETFRAHKETFRAQEETFRVPEETFRAQKEVFRAQEEAFRARKESFRAQKEVFRTPEETFRVAGNTVLPDFNSLKYKPVCSQTAASSGRDCIPGSSAAFCGRAAIFPFWRYGRFCGGYKHVMRNIP